MAHQVKIELRAEEEPDGKYRIVAVATGPNPIGKKKYSSPDAAVNAFCRAIGAAMDATQP